MQINGTLQGNARTYLTHMFGRGLDDERYVVERFTSTADGESAPSPATGAPGAGASGRAR